MLVIWVAVYFSAGNTARTPRNTAFRRTRYHAAASSHPLVERYLAFACASKRKIASATLRQEGFLRADSTEPWMIFTATERFTLDPLAFRWEASVCRGFLRISVRDMYERGRGASIAKLFGLIPLGSQSATPQVNEASLVRMLAESPWIPTLLRDERIAWEEVSSQALRATLTDGGVRASATITFAAEGEIAAVDALRYRDVRGAQVLTPWRGRFKEYEPMNGMLLPLRAYVEWIPPEGAVEVWRGRITGASFQDKKCSATVSRA